MALFVVEAKHDAERCPAGHPEMGPMLVTHVSQVNAAKFGIQILGDAVVNGGHTFYVILEAETEAKVKEYMAPFAQMGPVEILPSSSCEQVVSRGKC